ncbi:CoA ester lyase [uncultured Marinobacter sp.]|uniref:HpcH/HpaI aldolase/citrate lyase family protein n=1 Tax=uncultured Marinobacter sp. TaxID=187379 RepID=UPI002586E250|nr:CoA ester lyase [uncultured Marinobacter sp.]
MMVSSETGEHQKELKASLCSILFVPGSRLDRIQKALNSGADAVIVDLEDAVAETDKVAARTSVDRFLADNPQVRVLIRINAAGTEHFVPDLEMCSRQPGVAGIMLPKSEDVHALAKVADCGKPVWPLVETAKGVLEIPQLIRCPGVVRMSFGALDLCAELDLKPQSKGAVKVLDHCRCQLVLNSCSTGLEPPVESVYPDINNAEAVEQAARHARQMGLTGMLCIHPRQLEPVHRAFEPDTKDVEWARRVIDKVTDSEAAFTLDDQMIDAPVIARARKILAAFENHTRSKS